MQPVWGTQNTDTWVGSATADYFILLGGDDVAQTLEGDDIVLAGTGNDAVDAGGGDDVVFGGLGNDVVVGGAGNDYLLGGGGDKLDVITNEQWYSDGNDVLDGGAGDDVLDGAGGNDRLTGGTGADLFIFSLGEGNDVITDFTKGQDGLGLWIDPRFGFADLDTSRNGVLDSTDVGVTVANGNTVIDFSAYGSANTLTVIGVSNLAAGDFVNLFA